MRIINRCSHVNQVNDNIKGNTTGYKWFEKIGSDWVHLRLSFWWIDVGCCDSSVNKHGTKHFQETTHPAIKSYEPGEKLEMVLWRQDLYEIKLVI